MCILSIVIITGIVAVSAQEDYSIPEWIKNTAGWWSDGGIYDGEFVDALQFLIDEEILQIQDTSYKNTKIPDVLLTTDKNVYKLGEDVIISFNNLSDEKIKIKGFFFMR